MMEIFVTIAKSGYWEEATNVVIYAGTDFIKAIEAFRDTLILILNIVLLKHGLMV